MSTELSAKDRALVSLVKACENSKLEASRYAFGKLSDSEKLQQLHVIVTNTPTELVYSVDGGLTRIGLMRKKDNIGTYWTQNAIDSKILAKDRKTVIERRKVAQDGAAEKGRYSLELAMDRIGTRYGRQCITDAIQSMLGMEISSGSGSVSMKEKLSAAEKREAEALAREQAREAEVQTLRDALAEAQKIIAEMRESK